MQSKNANGKEITQKCSYIKHNKYYKIQWSIKFGSYTSYKIHGINLKQ